MTVATIQPAPVSGAIEAIASKSYAHRMLMAAALADKPVTVACPTRSQDILATARVLTAMGAVITDSGDAFHVTPIACRPEGPIMNGLLDCGESGTTERFIVPIAAALGLDASITGQGRLPQRPLSPLSDVLKDHGIALSEEGRFPLSIKGRLDAGDYEIAGNVSSQFVGGLLYALSVIEGVSTLTLTGTIESAPYIRMTVDVLRSFGAVIDTDPELRVFRIEGRRTLTSPGNAVVEGDWSNAAFWLCAGAIAGDGMTVKGVNLHSAQGDRAVVDILKRFGADVQEDPAAGSVTVRPGRLKGITVDARQIPDLVPVLSVVAAEAQGPTHFINAGRLRIKESDRLETTAALLRALGARCTEGPDFLTVTGGDGFTAGTVDGANDHRIVMAAAVAATAAAGPVVINGSQAVRKSYPLFFEDFAKLGGLGSSQD